MTEPGPFDVLDGLGADELRQRLHALEALIARAPVPIAIAHDPECRFISANRALATLLGLPEDANYSLTPPEGGPAPYRIRQEGRDLPPEELPMQYAIAHRTLVRNEIEIVRADGTVLHIQNDVEPLFDRHGRAYGCISVCVDVTERKLSEIALRNADRRKDEFLATLSHELRNPLAPIRTALEIIRLARDNPELVDKARAAMERQVTQLVRITDDLLDVARITQNKVELRCERLDLRAVLHSAIEATRPLVDERGHALIVDFARLPVWTDADFTRLSQVFANLLNNAVKFTPHGGLIRVSVAEADGWAVAAVTDNGAGIEPRLLPQVFEMFAQLHPRGDRTHGGLGIGLTLVRRLVELHGGTIEAHSEGEGHGSCFTVRLPLARGAEAERPPAHAERAATGTCRILVAEDNEDAAEMMRVMLEVKGHDVRIASDGVEAVALAETFEPQIAFLDIGMPRMDGYEAARRIRERLQNRVTLVALTGWGQDEDRVRSREAGFDHHLTKPPEPDQLDQLIVDCARR
jgi:PAS domain S-box-containing protein